MKTALITGGLGFIGSNLTKILIERKIVSRCILLDSYTGFVNPTKESFIDQRKYRFKNKKNIIIERGDAKDFRLVYKVLDLYKPEIIFHTAAIPLAKIDNLNANEAKIGSIDTTTNILECINFFQSRKKYNINRFVYISSSMIYGDFKKNIVTETSDSDPKEIYGTMKLAGEIITKGLCKFYKIPFTIIRPSAVYGPTDMNNRVSQIFVEKALKGQEITIQGKDEKLDFTFVEDLANGCILAGIKKKGINQTFNITYGKAQSLYNFVKILSKRFKKLKFKITKRDNFRPKRGTLSTYKAQKLLKYKPKYNLLKGVNKYLDFIDFINKKK
jgi:nucleoside-diphosphate-sugar epimerase